MSKNVRSINSAESKGQKPDIQVNNRRLTRLLRVARTRETIVEFMTFHELAHVQKRNRQLHEAGCGIIKVRLSEMREAVTKKIAIDAKYRLRAAELFASRLEEDNTNMAHAA